MGFILSIHRLLSTFFYVLLPLLICQISLAVDKHILIIGDSLTAGYGVSKKASYPSQLAKILEKSHPGYKVINAGSSGSTSASGLSRLKWHLKRKPNLLILALGANDGLRGFPVSATKDNLGKVIDTAKLAGVKVFLAGMKMPTNYEKKYRQEFEQVYPDLAKTKAIGLIPFLLDGVGGDPKLNLADGIHPNEEGHKVIANTVYQSIKEPCDSCQKPFPFIFARWAIHTCATGYSVSAARSHKPCYCGTFGEWQNHAVVFARGSGFPRQWIH